jgi:hypothetical protein
VGGSIPPPPPRFRRKFGPFSGNPQGGSGFFANRGPAQGLWTGCNRRPEKVLADVSAIALLDHLQGRSTVFREPFQVGSLRKRPRDERVPRHVELPRPNSKAAKTPKPDALRLVINWPSCCSSLRPPSVRHWLPFRTQEDEFRPIGMKSSWQSLQKIDDPREHWNLATRSCSFGCIILAFIAAARYRNRASLQVDVIPSQRGGFAVTHTSPKQKE